MQLQIIPLVNSHLRTSWRLNLRVWNRRKWTYGCWRLERSLLQIRSTGYRLLQMGRVSHSITFWGFAKSTVQICWQYVVKGKARLVEEDDEEAELEKLRAEMAMGWMKSTLRHISSVPGHELTLSACFVWAGIHCCCPIIASQLSLILLYPFLRRSRFLCLNLFCFTNCSLFSFSLEIILATTLWAVMYASSFYRPHTPSSLTESSHRFRLIQMQTTEVFECHPLLLNITTGVIPVLEIIHIYNQEYHFRFSLPPTSSLPELSVWSNIVGRELDGILGNLEYYDITELNH